MAAGHIADPVAKETIGEQREFLAGSIKLATAASIPALPVPERATLNLLFVEYA